jgi:hypothetical protein
MYVSSVAVPIIPDLLLDIDKLELKEQLMLKNESFYENGTTIYVITNVTSHHYNKSAGGHDLAQRVLELPLLAITENSKVGWLLSSKALVQLVANPFIGPLSNR